MTPLEWTAAALGLVNIVLIVRRSVWNYPFALVMVSLYGFVFFEAKLYSDTLLQIFFLVVNVYGWWHWAHARAAVGEVRVETLGWAARWAWLGGCVVAAALWGWLMHRYTDAAYPWWDAGVAMLSVAAQLLMSRRYLENWMLWIAADLLAIPLYAAKGLWPTALLYGVFLIVSLVGLIGWQRARHA
jgi:nicotinamide mononucleotide transporter